MYFILTFFPLLQSNFREEKQTHRLHSNWNANFSSGISLAFKIGRLIPNIPSWSRGMKMCAYTTRSKFIDSVTSSILASIHCSCNHTPSSNGVLITFQRLLQVFCPSIREKWYRGFCLIFVRSVLSLCGWSVMLIQAIPASSNCYIKNVPSARGWAQRWTCNRGNWENVVWLPNTPKNSFFIAVIHHLFWALCQHSNFQQLLSRDLTALFLL